MRILSKAKAMVNLESQRLGSRLGKVSLQATMGVRGNVGASLLSKLCQAKRIAARTPTLRQQKRMHFINTCENGSRELNRNRKSTTNPEDQIETDRSNIQSSNVPNLISMELSKFN